MRTKLIITLLAMLVGLVIAALGQTPSHATLEKKSSDGDPTIKTEMPVKDYKLTKEQSLELENLQLKAQLRQRALQDAQTAFQQSLLDLTQKAEQVKSANKWDTRTQFDPNTLTFSAPPPDKPTPETKKP